MHTSTTAATRPNSIHTYHPDLLSDPIETYIRQNPALINRLVYSQYIPDSDRDDLLQEARLGFYEAFESYDSQYGTKLSTHCYRVARDRITNYRRKLERNPSCEVHGYFKYEKPSDSLTADSPPVPNLLEHFQLGSYDPTFDNAELVEFTYSIPERIRPLTDREYEAIGNVIFLERSSTDTARDMHVSVPRISALIKSATLKMAS